MAILVATVVAEAPLGENEEIVEKDFFDTDLWMPIKQRIVVDHSQKAAHIDSLEPESGPTFGKSRVA
jgi:hypothetical protein